MNDREGHGYRQFDHTGDIGIIVRAPSLAGIYEGSARALFDILLDLDAVRDREALDLALTGRDREDLLVRWLAELLFLFDARGLAFSRFDILDLTGSEGGVIPTANGGAGSEGASVRLSARAWGEPFDPSRHAMRTELKAVTYHQILVSEDSDGWSARVIFDI